MPCLCSFFLLLFLSSKEAIDSLGIAGSSDRGVKASFRGLISHPVTSSYLFYFGQQLAGAGWIF